MLIISYLYDKLLFIIFVSVKMSVELFNSMKHNKTHSLVNRIILVFAIVFLLNECTPLSQVVEKEGTSPYSSSVDDSLPYFGFNYNGVQIIQYDEYKLFTVHSNMGGFRCSTKDGDVFKLYAPLTTMANETQMPDLVFEYVWLCFPWDEIKVGSMVSVTPNQCFFQVKTEENIFEINGQLYRGESYGRQAPVKNLSVLFSELSDSYAKCSFEALVEVNAWKGTNVAFLSDGVFQVFFTKEEQNNVEMGFDGKEYKGNKLVLIGNDEENN